MPAVVDVPLNTCLADLDEALRTLLRRELERHGFEGVDIAFDAPATDWSAKLTNPTVNLFLYDLRENVAEADVTTRNIRVNGTAIAAPPPMRLEVTYSVTAWTKAVQDEHRLLSQVLAILFSHVSLPSDLLEGRLASASLLRAIETEVGRPKEEKAGLTFTRGPEVRTQTVNLGIKEGPRRTFEELVRFGGIVRDKDGEPVANAWVVLPDLGRFASTNQEGQFTFDGMRPGSHRVVARTTAGEEASGTATVPGGGVDLELGGGGRKRSPAKRG
jgi:hypothetical protein